MASKPFKLPFNLHKKRERALSESRLESHIDEMKLAREHSYSVCSAPKQPESIFEPPNTRSTLTMRHRKPPHHLAPSRLTSSAPMEVTNPLRSSNPENGFRNLSPRSALSLDELGIIAPAPPPAEKPVAATHQHLHQQFQQQHLHQQQQLLQQLHLQQQQLQQQQQQTPQQPTPHELTRRESSQQLTQSQQTLRPPSPLSTTQSSSQLRPPSPPQQQQQPEPDNKPLKTRFRHSQNKSDTYALKLPFLHNHASPDKSSPRASDSPRKETAPSTGNPVKAKYNQFVEEMMGVAVYVDYKIKKMMEEEIARLRTMQEKLCYAVLERDKSIKRLEMENRTLREELAKYKPYSPSEQNAYRYPLEINSNLTQSQLLQDIEREITIPPPSERHVDISVSSGSYNESKFPDSCGDEKEMEEAMTMTEKRLSGRL